MLLTCPDGPLDTARIADEAGFAKRNISDVLTSLTDSGVIKAAWAGNERHFTVYRERWALLLDLASSADMPSFVSWVHLLPAALEIVMWLDEKADTAESEYLIASQARRLMNRLARDLEAGGINLRAGGQPMAPLTCPCSPRPAAPSSPGWELLASAGTGCSVRTDLGAGASAHRRIIGVRRGAPLLETPL